MANKINGVVKEKKKKKTVKEELSDLVIDVIKKDTYIKLKFNKILKPYQRNRLSGRSLNSVYDPLNTYKDFIKRRIIKLINEYNSNHKNKIKIIPDNYEIMVIVKVYMTPPKTFSKIKQLYCLKGDIKPITKPDNDNYEKTIFDILNKVIWGDDSNVVYNRTEKIYGIKNETIVTIQFKPQKDYSGERINKEIKLELKNNNPQIYKYLFKD